MTRVLEVRGDGSLLIPADMLDGAAPQKRYIAESDGQDLLLRPEARIGEKLPRDEWWRQWDALAEQIGRSWTSDKTAAGTVSEMRR